jgi:hypothetical protein
MYEPVVFLFAIQSQGWDSLKAWTKPRNNAIAYVILVLFALCPSKTIAGLIAWLVIGEQPSSSKPHFTLGPLGLTGTADSCSYDWVCIISFLGIFDWYVGYIVFPVILVN